MRAPGVECQVFKLSSATSADSPQDGQTMRVPRPAARPSHQRSRTAATRACSVSDAKVVVGIRVKSCIRAYGMRRKAPFAEYSDAFWSEIAKTFDAGEDLG